MRRFAFTLVELLVVIAIIGILVGLLVPAVQAARESGRRLQCSNNLNQFTKAALQHESAHTCYPTGGWSGSWSGDPNFGTGQGQPGGWTYNLLPFLESQTVHDLGIGLPPSSNKTLLGQAAQTLIGGFYCPTRRATALYPITTWTCNSSNPPSGPSLRAMHTDYAANAGTNQAAATLWGSVPTSGDPGAVVSVKGFQFPDTSSANGVIFTLSMVANAEIHSGTGNTILFGEKYMDSSQWTSGQDQGDTGQLFAGFSNDCQRWGATPPMSDRSGLANPTAFGSAHTTGLNIFMCDGSGHWMNFNIDPATFASLCNRNNGTPIDNSKLGW